MKALYPHQANPFFLNATMLVVLLPLFGLVGQMLRLSWGLGPWFQSAGPPAVDLNALLAILIALVAAAAVVVLWKGWVNAALGILGVACLAIGFWSGGRPGQTKAWNVELVIGAHSPVTGVDVFCNGVHLGKTPLRISLDDFRRKVKPWTKPPRQDRLEPYSFPEAELSHAKYWWVPQDVFEQYEHGLSGSASDKTRYAPHNDKQALRVLKSSRYWWHFEAGEHAGLTTMANFAGGAHGTNWLLEVDANPDTAYPALEPHLDILVEALRAADYRPTSQWIAHFRKHQSLLFLPFYGRVRQDSRLRPALEAVARAELDLPEAPTPEDCDRALGAILDRVEARVGFAVPSMESLALDLMGDAARGPVVRRFRQEAGWQPTYFAGSTRDDWRLQSRGREASRQLPLEYAVKRLVPAELFDWLFYERARSGRYLEILAHYPREEATRLLLNHLRDLERKSIGRHQVAQALDWLVEIRNPELEPWIRQFIQEKGFDRFAKHSVIQFVGSRIGAPDVDQSDLAGWVYHFAPLDERQKLELLAQIDSPRTWNYVQISGATRDPVKRQNLIQRLAQHLNASLDQFLIDSYPWCLSSEGQAYYYHVTEALVEIGTPGARAFLTERWGHDEERREMVRLVAWGEGRLPNASWMLPLIEQCPDAVTRQRAAGLLARIDTEPAWKLLEQWAEKDPDDGVRRAAQEELRKRLQRQQEAEEKAKRQARQFADLVSGKIRPDDLVPAQPAWVWDGNRYVEQSE